MKYTVIYTKNKKRKNGKYMDGKKWYFINVIAKTKNDAKEGAKFILAEEAKIQAEQNNKKFNEKEFLNEITIVDANGVEDEKIDNTYNE